MATAPTVRQRLEALLRERASAPIPFGLFTEIAEEVGCSREYVRRIARQMGVDAAVTRSVSRYRCGRCGAAITRYQANRTGCCPSCNEVTLPCESCGKPVTRPIWLLRRPEGSESPRFYCDHRCKGRGLGRMNAGRTKPGAETAPGRRGAARATDLADGLPAPDADLLLWLRTPRRRSRR